MTRLLTIMGSGETAPTMVKVHRSLIDRLAGGPAQSGPAGAGGPAPAGPAVPAVLLDTPFGFQENAGELSAKAMEYFRDSVGRPIEVARMRQAAGDPVEREASLARIASARYVFAGPGSPSYALRQWSGTEVPSLLTDKLRHGGAVTFASAAALTLGVATVPVYEIYKVGAEPAWLPGLDLLAEAGLSAAVIPHYDNAEGGGHDTRFCYLGERRLRAMEDELPEGAFVLGVDEHTGLILDLDAGTATVVGLGTVTVRAGGRSTTLPTGTSTGIDDLRALAAALAGGAPIGSQVAVGAGTAGGAGAGGDGAAGDAGSGPAAGDAGSGPAAGDAGSGPAAGAAGSGAAGSGPAAGSPADGPRLSPLMAGVRDHEAEFEAALAARDPAGAVRAILELDDTLASWAADTLQSDELDRGRAALRRMVVRLGDLAKLGARDPRLVVGPYIEALLEVRTRARADRRFADADVVRDRLVAAGVEVRDTAGGTEWDLAGGP